MAFISVKRRHDEDPFHSILMAPKKLKTVGMKWSMGCIFQFVATVIDENENLVKVFKKKVHERDEKSVKCLTKTNKIKNINDVVAHAKAERLKFVSNFRAVNQDVVPNEENDRKNSEIKVIDIVEQAEDNQNNGKTYIDEGISIDYVHGLYYEYNAIDIQNIDSRHVSNLDKIYDIHRSIIESDSDFSLSEDEEDYDYESDDEDELVDMMNRLTLNRKSIRNFENKDTIGEYDM